MRVGVAIEETWDFFHPIYEEFNQSFETSLFKTKEFHLPIFNARVNQVVFRRDMQQFLRSNDVVFFEWASRLLAAATHQEKTCGIVTRLHRYEMYKWVNKINWDKVDRVILVSNALQQEFIEKFPAQAAKTTVVHPNISLEKFSMQPKTFEGNLGILCHMTPRKRVYDLILGFAELLEIDDRFSLHIAGDDHPLYSDYAASMRYLVQQLGIEKKVKFYGFLPDPSGWYKNIDIYVSNSYSEGIQVALIEAMASGCYGLSHGWKGVEELLPQEYIFYTNKTMIEKILAYAGKSEAERDVERAKMRAIACDKCDVEVAKGRIRSIVQEVGEKSGRAK